MNNWIFTPAFCKAEMMAEFLAHVTPIMPPDFKHVIIDDHYPIKKEATSQAIQALAISYGCIYIRTPKNLGLHHALNHAMRTLSVSDDDFYVNCDADDRPAPGTFQAMKQVMLADPTIAVLGCSFANIRDQKFFAEGREVIAGHTVAIHPNVEMWNVSAINMRFLKAIGGNFSEPYPYYGGIESYLYSKYRMMGLRLAYLVDYSSDCKAVSEGLVDREFQEFKRAHVNGPAAYPFNFEQFLKDRYPHLL